MLEFKTPESRGRRGSQDGLRLDRHQSRQPDLKRPEGSRLTGKRRDGTNLEGNLINSRIVRLARPAGIIELLSVSEDLRCKVLAPSGNAFAYSHILNRFFGIGRDRKNLVRTPFRAPDLTKDLTKDS